MSELTVGIDASRGRSGGAKAHLKGILSQGDPSRYGITKVHLWSYKSLLDAVPDLPWLIKHHPPELEGSLGRKVSWQYWSSGEEATAQGCDIMLNIDAGTVGRFRPSVVMSRDMLPFEPGERQRYGLSKARLRLAMLRRLTARSMRSADGVIFLTRHAAETIQGVIGTLPWTRLIPHGVGEEFRRVKPSPWPENGSREIRCLYVSNAAMYKHQWTVVRAIANLRNRGHNITLSLVGGGSGRAQALLDTEIARSDPDRRFVTMHPFVPHGELPGYLARADIFLFASSCENMPNTLVEGMAAGLPIACSNRGPMPEVLQNAGAYFDPEKENSIAEAVEKLIQDGSFRTACAGHARDLAEKYSWERCARETWQFLVETAERTRSVKPAPSALPAEKGSGYRICVNCVMDTTDSKITFGSDGVCDHCTTFRRDILPRWHPDDKGRQELDKVVARIKKWGEGKDFDCIIGVSGGIDSSYLTYLAKAELGLRPLVFHVDTGWNSKEAVHNIERLVDKLGLDLYTEVIDWAEMRDLQLAFFKSGVPHIDTPQDHAIFATMYRFAEKHDIKCILTGANLSTECIRNPLEWMYYQSDSIQLLDIHHKFGTIPLAKFPTTSILRHKVFLPYFKGIQVLRPLNYVPFTKRKAVDLLVEKIGWQPYPQKHFESRFTRFYEGYWLYKKFGYDTRRVQYSSLILTNQMTRAEALEQLKSPPLDEATVRQEFEYVATKLGISVAELETYFKAPNKTYRDYKSQESVYAVGAAVMRSLGMELGGKR